MIVLSFIIGVELGIVIYLLSLICNQKKVIYVKIMSKQFDFSGHIKQKVDILTCYTLDTEGKKTKVEFINYLN